MINISDSVKEFIAPVNKILLYYGIPITVFIIILILTCYVAFKVYNNMYIKKNHKKSKYQDIMGDCDVNIIVDALLECKSKTNNKY